MRGRAGWLLISLLLLVPLAPAVAQTPVEHHPIAAETSGRPEFPAGIEVSATLDIATADILRVDILFRAAQDPVLHLVPVATDAIVPHDEGTTLTAWVDLIASPLPAGIDLEAFWRVTTLDGTTLDTAVATLPWTDDRFAWVTSVSGNVRVHHYALSDAFVSSVSDAATGTIATMRDTYGIDFDEPVRIWVYDSTTDFRGTLAANSREAVAGVSYPGYGVIHLVLSEGNTREIGRTVTHEVAHQVIASALGEIGTIPLWLDEGIATHAQSEGDEGYLPLAVFAAANGKRFSLASLDGSFPFTASDASIAYAISWCAIAMIEERWGPEVIGRLVDALAEGLPVDAALQTVLGTTIADLDAMLDAWLAGRAAS